MRRIKGVNNVWKFLKISNYEQWGLSCIDGGNANDIGTLEDSLAFFFLHH